jgi:glycosyltransferase involved in cell wall biosynthesis
VRILFFSQYYTPEPPLRPCELAPALRARGHEVVVLTGYPSYPIGRVYDGYRTNGWRWELIDGVRVLRLPVFADHSNSALRRVLFYCSIAGGACVAGPFVAKGFDVAFVYSPPPTLGLAAIVTKVLRGVPFVYEVQDLWPESLPATGMIGSGTIYRAIDWMVTKVVRSAAALTVISPGFREHFVAKGVPRERIHVVPNWANEQVYAPAPADGALSRKLGFAGRFNVLYAGNIGLAQALGNVVEAASMLRDLPAVRFTIVGDGVERNQLEERARAEGLTNVVFLGRRSPEEMRELYALADALLIHLRKDPLFAITIPSKTIAYLAVGKPIIACIDGDTADMVTNAGAGVACEPEAPESLVAAVRTLHALSDASRAAMGAAARATFLGSYTRERIVGQIEEILAVAAADGRRRHSQIDKSKTV